MKQKESNESSELRALGLDVMCIRLLLCFALVSISETLVAECLPRECYVVVVSTSECSLEATGYLKLETNPSVFRAVDCYEDDENENSEILEPGKEISESSTYYYRAEDPKTCEQFLSEPQKLFLPAECCDTIPAYGNCVYPNKVLMDLPPHVE